MNADRPTFSVVVPTLQEHDEIAATLAHARTAIGDDAELIVVDGGSSDGTAHLARGDARVIFADPCRGAQLAAGAAEARGDILLFLHADTWLPQGSGDAIRAAVESGATGGCLRITFREAPDIRYQVLAAAINLRTTLFRTATGDQAIFATREAYRNSGGIPEIPIFEDVRFVRRLRAAGEFRPLPRSVATSARRWERDGFLRTVTWHLWLRTLHAFGVDPERLANRYRENSRAEPDGAGGPLRPPGQ